MDTKPRPFVTDLGNLNIHQFIIYDGETLNKSLLHCANKVINDFSRVLLPKLHYLFCERNLLKTGHSLAISPYHVASNNYCSCGLSCRRAARTTPGDSKRSLVS
jgi:hypothetical protein